MDSEKQWQQQEMEFHAGGDRETGFEVIQTVGLQTFVVTGIPAEVHPEMTSSIYLLVPSS
jgi:hypothetical protein